MLLYLDFCSQFEATGLNCFNVFSKILLQSIFVVRIISCSPKRRKKKTVSWNVVAISLLGNFGYQTDRTKRKFYDRSKITAAQPPHDDITLLTSIGTPSCLLQGKYGYQTDGKKVLCPKPNDSTYDPRAFRTTSHNKIINYLSQGACLVLRFALNDFIT